MTATTQLTQGRREPLLSLCPRLSPENRMTKSPGELRQVRSHKTLRYCGGQSTDVELTTSSHPRYGPNNTYSKLNWELHAT